MVSRRLSDRGFGDRDTSSDPLTSSQLPERLCVLRDLSVNQFFPVLNDLRLGILSA
jgi:hypothetical protein